jgi:hypothetical protein
MVHVLLPYVAFALLHEAIGGHKGSRLDGFKFHSLLLVKSFFLTAHLAAAAASVPAVFLYIY